VSIIAGCSSHQEGEGIRGDLAKSGYGRERPVSRRQLPVERELAEVFRVSDLPSGKPPSLESQGFIEPPGRRHVHRRKPRRVPGPPCSSSHRRKTIRWSYSNAWMIEPDLAISPADGPPRKRSHDGKGLALQQEQIDRGDFETDVTGISIHHGEGRGEQGPPAHHRQHHGLLRNRSSISSEGDPESILRTGSARAIRARDRRARNDARALGGYRDQSSGHRETEIEAGIVTSLEKGVNGSSRAVPPIRIVDKRRRMDTMADVLK